MNRLNEIKVISMESKLQGKDLTLCATSRERESLLALFRTSKDQMKSGKCSLMAEGTALPSSHTQAPTGLQPGSGDGSGSVRQRSGTLSSGPRRVRL